MHAWRALAEMQPVVAIDAMLTIHKAVLEETDSDQPTDDLIDLCVRVGGAALPSLERYLSDTSMERARMAVAESIGKIGVEHPEQRTCCVAMLARQFGTLRGKRRLR
jgi:hypothetical protein